MEHIDWNRILPMMALHENLAASSNFGEQESSTSSSTFSELRTSEEEVSRHKSLLLAGGDASSASDRQLYNMQVISNKKLHYIIHGCSSSSSTYAAE